MMEITRTCCAYLSFIVSKRHLNHYLSNVNRFIFSYLTIQPKTEISKTPTILSMLYRDKIKLNTFYEEPVCIKNFEGNFKSIISGSALHT